MIKTFADKMTEDIYQGVNSRYARKLPVVLQAKARRLLDQLESATQIETLRVPPSNKLGKLTGNLAGHWRIKIDKQWAIIFKWDNQHAYDVKLIDYH